MHDQVLQFLRATDGYLSGQEISRRLGVSRAAVWKIIQTLREEGYEIESGPNRGYRLVSGPDLLNQAELLAALGDHPWADRLVVLPTVDSTNNYAKKLAAEGAPHGTVVVANAQTGGRGRQGRSFASPEGVGIYLTVLLRPQARPDQISHLTAMAAVAACDAVETACGVRPGIKWTNDLVLDGKKLAGILSELSVEWESSCIDHVVVGIGINCNHTLDQFPPEVQPMATSLQLSLGHPVRRCELVAALIRALSAMADGLLTEKQQWMDRYAADCVTLGRDVQVLRGNTCRTGHADGLDPDGALRVTYDDGTQETVFSGEVSVRGLYGYV
jgi:BirA family biotin operon repressor/biotin-[acetyl-CoA-carboxylase] ligase